jgi:phosphonate transport system permease protein
MSDFAAAFAELERRRARRALRLGGAAAALGGALIAAFVYADVFSPRRYADALPTLLQLAADSLPPDFGRWRAWGTPLAETLAMSVAGTTLGAMLAAPLALLAARNVCPHAALGAGVRLLMNLTRSIPCLIWAVMFVAAVGFGPLPGVLALGVHSSGMLGKLFAEAFEHADPAPGAALEAQGLSRLAVARFAILPQALPRLVDALLYRFEHDLRSATTLGLVGAGGLGLEIVTAFHLFEYREASALIVVMLGLVVVVNAAGGELRRCFLSRG